MLTAFERMVAFRYLRARREEGLISIIALFSLVGIALGVATLIVVLAVMNGVRAEMINSIIGLEGHITVYSRSGSIAEYDELTRTIMEFEQVESAVPKVEGQIMASAHNTATGAMVAGYRSDDLQYKPLLIDKIVDGDIGDLERGEGVVIGQRMAERLRLGVGDTLTLISPEGRATIAGLVPRVKAYKVVGIFSIGMFAYDNGLILLPFTEAQTYFKLRDNGRDTVSSIEIKTHDATEAKVLASSLQSTLGEQFRVYDWESSNAHIFQAVIVQRNVMFLILMLIIVVASFNIISSLIMLVREKGNDIAILRTIGASRASVMRIFITCGASVGVIGTALGVALGLLIALNTESIQAWLESLMGQRLFPGELYFLSHLPAKVESGEVIMVIIMALSLAFLATIYPAKRAASLDPVEGLRYE